MTNDPDLDPWWLSLVTADDSTAIYAWRLSWIADDYRRLCASVSALAPEGTQDRINRSRLASAWRVLAEQWTAVAIEREGLR